MSKKWMAVAGVAILLVAAALLTSCKKASTTIPSTVIGSGGATSAVSSTTTGSVNASGVPLTQGQVTPGTSQGGSNGSSSTADEGPLRPFPKVPASNLPARASSGPIPNGSAIPPLTSAPSNTISGLKAGLVPDGAIYFVTMHPYGFGPSNAFGTRMVIHVDKVEALGKAPANSHIANSNVLVLLDTNRGGGVTTGGKYTAILTFRSDGTKLVPVLRGAKISK